MILISHEKCLFTVNNTPKNCMFVKNAYLCTEKFGVKTIGKSAGSYPAIM